MSEWPSVTKLTNDLGARFQCCQILNVVSFIIHPTGSCLFYLHGFQYSITNITPQRLQQNAINFCLNEYSKLHWTGNSHYKFKNIL